MDAPVSPDHEIVSRRRIAAPREKVFRAFAEPQRLARWWGPAGFRNSFEHFDFRPGGQWKFVMHGPDGRDYDNESRFEEIEAPARIVLRHMCEPFFTLRMNLSEAAGGTDIEWRMQFDSAEVREKLAPICVPANEQNFDRLEAELATMP